MNSDGPQKPSEKWDGPNAWPLSSPLSIFVCSPPFTTVTIKFSLTPECDHALWQEHHDHIMRPERGAEGFQGFDWPAQTNLSKEGLRRQGGPSSRTAHGRRRLRARRYRCCYCCRPSPRTFGLWPGPTALWPRSLICQLDGHTSCVTTHNTACQTRGGAERRIHVSPWIKSQQRLRPFTFCAECQPGHTLHCATLLRPPWETPGQDLSGCSETGEHPCNPACSLTPRAVWFDSQ